MRDLFLQKAQGGSQGGDEAGSQGGSQQKGGPTVDADFEETPKK